MANQRQPVPLYSSTEVQAGRQNKTNFATQALTPAVGSVQTPTARTTQLIAVDFVNVALTTTITNGTAPLQTWPTVGFTGLFSAAQRYYTGPTSATASTMQPTSTNSMVVSQNTQLLLLCQVQTLTTVVGLAYGGFNLATLGFENQLNTSLKGPWFPGGTTYLAFSVTPSAIVFNDIGAGFSGTLNLGISAQLFSVFTQ